MGNYLASLRDLNKALELRGDEAWLLTKRAYIFKLIARGDRALADLDKALKLDPGLQEAWLLRGSLYFNDTQLDRAIGDLHQAIRLQPDDPTAYQLLAEALLHKGDTADALDKVGIALKKDSSFAQAYVTMGDIRLADSKVDKAIEAYSSRSTSTRRISKPASAEPNSTWHWISARRLSQIWTSRQKPMRTAVRCIYCAPDVTRFSATRKRLVRTCGRHGFSRIGRVVRKTGFSSIFPLCAFYTDTHALSHVKMHFRGKALASSRWSLDRVAFSWFVVTLQVMGVHVYDRAQDAG